MSRRNVDPDDARRILGEDDDESSGEDSGLDILKQTRKSLDLSQLIESVTSQSQPSYKSKAPVQEAFTDTDDEPHIRQPPLSRGSKKSDKRKPTAFSSDHETEDEAKEETMSALSDEDPSAEYLAFKNRRSLKRKAVAAETTRLRTQKKSRAAQATSIIGRKPAPKKQNLLTPHKNRLDPMGPASDSDVFSTASKGKEEVTYLDDPTPEYIEKRKRTLKKMHEAGLRFPPCYDGIDFSDDGEEEEKPVLHKDIKTQREKKDIVLRNETGGIIPAPIAQWLRDYQVDGVHFLHERFVRQTGAILGDDMGLGKTIQVIAFLTAAFGKTGTKRDAKRMRKMRNTADNRWYPRILVVCPGGLMQNWQDELEKWGWWIVDKFHGNPKDKRGVLNAMKAGRSEIMITTYSTYRNAESDINTIDWDCVIADECHQIKSKDAETTKAINRVNALCRIGLTGTAIQNKYEELWNLLNWARPGDYGSAQEWKQLISLPLKMGQAHDATHAQLANARIKAKELVENIMPDVFLRRMKTLIADQLPKKSDRIVFCQLTGMQADAYQAIVDSDMVEYIRRSREPCDCQSGKTRGWCCYQDIPGKGKWGHWMFPAMVTLTKVANHLALLVPQNTDLPEKRKKDIDNLQLACPKKWQTLYDMRDNIFDLSSREFCGKWSVLKRLLNFWHGNGDKVLVFSHSVRFLKLLKSLFTTDGTNYNLSYLDGSMSLEMRSKAVADFNSDPNQFVFLISTKAGGVGLNITSANKVVIMDPNWNPAYDLQAQDRAYRIGQTRDVEVFRLVSSGTIEEVVYARQVYKQQQANIGYTASDERRYFKGVMGEKGKKGELFGLENLFSFEENGYLLRDIVRKTNVAETRAGVNALDLNLEDDASDDEDDLLSNKSLGIMDDDGGNSEANMKMLLKKYTEGPVKKRATPNPINAILAKAGVQYTHENSEVIGESKIEAELSRRAMEVRNDLDLGKQRVFNFTQSQSQNPKSYPDFEERSDYTSEAEEEGDEHDVKIMGETRKGEFKINYKYRPNEDIRSRQFCSMAEMMGYEDPVEFALVVEDMTQNERRKLLQKFYRGRRRQIAKDWNLGKD